MSASRRLREVNLVWVLLAVTITEVAINRLTVPALRPPGNTNPPGWHRNLDLLGLFLFHLASMLGLCVLAQTVWRSVRRTDLYVAPARIGLQLAGLAFAGLALANIVWLPDQARSFAFEASFTLMLLLLVAAQAHRRGDVFAKLGLVLMAIPLVIHFYGPFAIRVLVDEEAGLWSSLPDRVRELGQWSLVLAALMSPYCFAPRPFRDSAARLAPLLAGGFVGIVGAVILRQHFEVGMLVASRGLGVELGPAMPTSLIALYLLALASMTWTAVSCLTAPSPARRLIGAGIALVVAGGYAFAWPLQYLAGMVGMLAIGEGAADVADEERNPSFGAHALHTPPIRGEAWQSFVTRLSEALQIAAVTVDKDWGASETRLTGARAGVDVDLRVVRREEAIHLVEVTCGGAAATGDPSWTIHARAERLLGIGAHPEPPPLSAPLRKTGDEAFDRRFRVRDASSHTDRMLDEDLRARATALLDGWMALWPERALRYRVFPGHGAPLDHPLPISELAFRGDGEQASVERMVAVVDLVSAMAKRAGLGRA